MVAGAHMEEIASVCVRQSLPSPLTVTSGFPPRWSGGHSTSAVSFTCDILHFFCKWITNDLFPLQMIYFQFASDQSKVNIGKSIITTVTPLNFRLRQQLEQLITPNFNKPFKIEFKYVSITFPARTFTFQIEIQYLLLRYLVVNSEWGAHTSCWVLKNLASASFVATWSNGCTNGSYTWLRKIFARTK